MNTLVLCRCKELFAKCVYSMIMIVGDDRVKYSTESCGEGARQRRERERVCVCVCCCKQVMVSVINLAVRENIYDGYRRIILDHLDGHYDYFLRLKYFLGCLLQTFHPTNKVSLQHTSLLQGVHETKNFKEFFIQKFSFEVLIK